MRAALMRIIKFEAKKVSMNENGSFNLYAAMRIWIPNVGKKKLNRIMRRCFIQKKVFAFESVFQFSVKWMCCIKYSISDR